MWSCSFRSYFPELEASEIAFPEGFVVDGDEGQVTFVRDGEDARHVLVGGPANTRSPTAYGTGGRTDKKQTRTRRAYASTHVEIDVQLLAYDPTR